MEIQLNEENSGTNCKSCGRYGKLGEVCVVEHGKKFLWEFCKDFEAEIKLPDYNELMQTIKLDMAAERKKIRDRKQKEIALRRKEREERRKEKLRLKRSRIAKRIWKERRKKQNSQKDRPDIFHESANQSSEDS